jgi:hypothetical protein
LKNSPFWYECAAASIVFLRCVIIFVLQFVSSCAMDKAMRVPNARRRTSLLQSP